MMLLKCGTDWGQGMTAEVGRRRAGGGERRAESGERRAEGGGRRAEGGMQNSKEEVVVYLRSRSFGTAHKDGPYKKLRLSNLRDLRETRVGRKSGSG